MHTPSLIVAWALVGYAALCQAQELIDRQGAVVLRGATVIDGSGAPPTPATTVVVQGGRIRRVGPDSQFRAGPGARIVNLAGKWLLPGFIDVHTHVSVAVPEPEILTTLVAFGITTIRSVATPDADLGMRGRLVRGELFGPALLSTGPLIDGPESVWSGGIAAKVRTEAEVRAEIQRQVGLGVDYIKVLCTLTPDLVRAAIDESHRAKLRVIGHMGRTRWLEAAEAGIDEITHSTYAGMAASMVPESEYERFRLFYTPSRDFPSHLIGPWRAAVDLNGPEMRRLSATLANRKVMLSPTLVLFEAQAWGDDPNALGRLEPKYATKSQRAAWEGRRQQHSAAWSAQEMADAKKNFPIFLEAIRMFHDRGVRISAGTDLGNPWMTPGVSYHRELQLLAQAGIPPLEVLKTATGRGAEALGIEKEAGDIGVGKRADLVVLADDPTKDIANTRRIERVILGGREYTPADLLNGRNR